MRRAIAIVIGIIAFAAAFSVPLQADDGLPIEMSEGDECVGLVPHLPTDFTRDTIRADVVVALDGVSKKTARKVMAKAAEPYAPGLVPQITPDVKINVIAYHDLTRKLKGSLVTGFVTNEYPTGTDLMSQLIRYYRSTYPKLKRAHVHLLTNKDIGAELVPGQRENAVLGIANCVGGVGTKHAYAITEVGVLKGPISIGPIQAITDLDAKVAAHEMGHVFGAHHHYANCGQTAPLAAAALQADVCTLMFNDASLIDLQFGPVEVAAIRGYVEAHLKR